MSDIAEIEALIEKAIPLSKDCHYERLRQHARREELKEGILYLLSQKCENCLSLVSKTSENENSGMGPKS